MEFPLHLLKKTMKKILLFALLGLASSMCFAGTKAAMQKDQNSPAIEASVVQKIKSNEHWVLKKIETTSVEKFEETNSVQLLQNSEKNPVVSTCTIKVNTEFDNGTRIEGTITITGISWWDCLKLKVYDLFSDDF